jgi:hypothetical protein
MLAFDSIIDMLNFALQCKKPRLESGAAMKRMFNAFLDSKKARVKLL